MKIELLECAVGAHGKGGPEVRSEGKGSVAAGLEHTLLLPLAVLDVPVVHCTISTAADQVRVIGRPLDTANLKTTFLV